MARAGLWSGPAGMGSAAVATAVAAAATTVVAGAVVAAAIATTVAPTATRSRGSHGGGHTTSATAPARPPDDPHRHTTTPRDRLPTPEHASNPRTDTTPTGRRTADTAAVSQRMHTPTPRPGLVARPPRTHHHPRPTRRPPA